MTCMAACGIVWSALTQGVSIQTVTLDMNQTYWRHKSQSLAVAIQCRDPHHEIWSHHQNATFTTELDRHVSNNIHFHDLWIRKQNIQFMHHMTQQ